jgi:branched-chain amino acid transport system permease protein
LTRLALAPVAVVAALAWPFVIHDPALVRAGLQVLVLSLAGLSLTVTVGWLRTISLYQPAAMAAAAALTTVMIGAGQAPPIAFVAATATGIAVALLAYMPVARSPRRWFPLSSLLVTVAVAEYLLPRFAFVPFPRPILFGIDLTGDRAVYLVGVAAVATAAIAVGNLYRSDLGRRLRAAGADPALVDRSGADPRRLWRHGLLVSGALAGAGGWLDALLQQGFAGPRAYGPEVAVALLAIPLLGGAYWASGALIGALLYLGGLRLGEAVALSPLVLAAGAVAAIIVLGGSGVVGWLRQRPDPPWRRLARGPVA